MILTDLKWFSEHSLEGLIKWFRYFKVWADFEKCNVLLTKPHYDHHHHQQSHLQCRRPKSNPWVRKMPWRRKWQPTPAFLPGKCYGQRILLGYSPRGGRESDTTEWLTAWVCHINSCSPMGHVSPSAATV